MSAKRPGDPDEEDDATPATRSYIDALLQGNMSEAEIASLKAEIAANPNAAGGAPPSATRRAQPSSMPAPRPSRPAGPPSNAPAPRPSRPVGPPSSAPAQRVSVPAPPGFPASVRPSAPPLPIDIDPFGDDEDQAPTLYRPSSRAPAPISAPPSVRLHLPDPPSLDLELGELFGDDAQRAPSSTREEIPVSVRGERRSAALDHTYLDALGGPAGVLHLAVPQAQLHALPLVPQAAFVVSCIDGGSSVDDIIDISSLGRLETLRILYDLMQQGVIAVSGR